MYFLNGDRIYINPDKACVTLDDQLQNCLQKLNKINSEKVVFKLNIFADTRSDNAYQKFVQNAKLKISKLVSNELILCVLAQPPLTSKIILEAFFYDPFLWDAKFIANRQNHTILFSREQTEILIGNVQADLKCGCKLNAENAFSDLTAILINAHFPINTIIRQWNYLEDILGFDGDRQHYQEFNDVRSDFYGKAFIERGYPSATGIGMNRGGIILEFVAVKSALARSVLVDNPGQIAAPNYSNKVLIGEEFILKTTPKFERARYLELFGKKLIFISGTASIVGENTVGVNDPIEQTEVTINNIQRLYSDEILLKIGKDYLNPKYGHARIYVNNRMDFPMIKKVFKTHFGRLPVVYILADICRKDLVVEIEGEVILE